MGFTQWKNQAALDRLALQKQKAHLHFHKAWCGHNTLGKSISKYTTKIWPGYYNICFYNMCKPHICLFQMHDIKKNKILVQSVQWRKTMQTTQESWLISESRMKTRIAISAHFFLGLRWMLYNKLPTWDKCRHLNSTQHTKWIQLINTCTWNLEFCNYKMVIG